MHYFYCTITTLLFSMLFATASAQPHSLLARKWQFVRVERGPDMQGMANVPAAGDQFDLTGLQPLPTNSPSTGFWLVEQDGKQFIQQGDGQLTYHSSSQEAPVRSPFYYEVLVVAPERLRLAVWAKLPQFPRAKHWLTYELKLSE
ncbi:hypothetical protein LJ737_26615 [Hymenobacter sp. 15J16-1T3B]|uniref:hypothetical protein n=1 Tax=Hymenobacter sp. 15J16-1T3B TaxID=2886941 RepID=UPI001D103FE1|nr:hypothetical protein [Hymenobacter sp. 15J16-1T3B]MCC3160839.1 hypothetical protein [Hymenobacter sp. 15J16-1T3B]